MKYYLIAVFLLLAACTAPADDAQRALVGNIVETQVDVSDYDETIVVDQESGSVGFEGFGPGKSHEATLTSWRGEVYLNQGQIVGGTGVVDLSAIDYPNERLVGHLQSEDFFDVENHPKAIFDITNVDGNTVSGTLEIRGVTREISFPVERNIDGVSADFIFDFSQFNWSYAGANDEVRVFFDFEV